MHLDSWVWISVIFIIIISSSSSSSTITITINAMIVSSRRLPVSGHAIAVCTPYWVAR